MLLRVLAVIGNLGFGGAERQLIELSNNIDRTEFDFHIAVLSKHIPLAQSLIEPDKRLHIIKKICKYDFTTILRLVILINRLKINVIQGFLIDSEIASRLAGWLTNKPVIGSERNSLHEYKKSHFVLLQCTKKIMKICISNNYQGVQFHKNVFKLTDSTYRVIYNGVDTKKFYPRNVNNLKIELGIKENDRIIGIFGSFKRQKNHALFFSAMEKVIQKILNIRLLIVGSLIHEGSEPTLEYSKSIDHLIDELKLRKYCIFLNARNDVEQLYNLCEVTVLTSLFEGTPNVALESMASGIPVIATDVGDNKHVIPDGKVGFIVPLGDKLLLADRICTVLNDVQLRRTLSQNARDWVLNHFSIKHMTDQYAAIYREVIGNTCDLNKNML